MENKGISIGAYYDLNREYLNQKEELEKKIRQDLVDNRDLYPVGAEEIYCFEYSDKISEDDEKKLVEIESKDGDTLVISVE